MSVRRHADHLSGRPALHSGPGQSDAPALHLLGSLARPEHEEDLHHRAFLAHLPGSGHAHRHHVLAHRGQAGQAARLPPEAARGQHAPDGGAALRRLLASALDPHDADRLRKSFSRSAGSGGRLYLPLRSLAGLLQQQRQSYCLRLLQRELPAWIPGSV